MKLAKNIFSIFIGLFSLVAMSDAVAEKMAMPAMVKASEALTFFKTEQKKRKLTSDETNIIKSIQVAQEVFKVDDFIVDGYYQENEKVKHLNARSVSLGIQRTIKQYKNWDEAISSADMEKIKSIEDLIKTTLGADSYAVAWLTYKNGNKTEAKTLLNRGFDQAYENAMKMEYIGFSDEGNPIQDAELYSQALKPISTDAENKSRADRLKKAQVRASNLPQIMT